MTTILRAAYFNTLSPPPPRNTTTSTNINYYVPSYRSKAPITSPPPSMTEVPSTTETNNEGEKKMTVQEGILFVIVMLLLILSVTCMSISLIICLQDRASRNQTGEALRQPFAIIKPTNCDVKTIGRYKYGNDTNMIWNELGWNVYPLIGICPIAGIMTNPFSNNYRGCIDFVNTNLWQDLDRQNALAGTTTNLVSAANTLVAGSYKGGLLFGCIIAGTVFIWITSILLLCTANDPYLIAAMSLPTRCTTVLLGYSLPYLLAFALFLQAFNGLISSPILQASSYINSLFQSCNVSINYTDTVSYQQFISLIVILSILTFVFTVVLIVILPKLNVSSSSSSAEMELTDPPTGSPLSHTIHPGLSPCNTEIFPLLTLL